MKTNNAGLTRPKLWLTTALIGLVTVLMPSYGTADEKTPGGNQWVQEHLLNATSSLPFSFVYGRQGSEELLKTWTKKVDTHQLDGRTEYKISWTDPKTGLEVRLAATSYAGSAVVEWTGYFKNGGSADTPILEDVAALETSLAVTGKNTPTIIYSRGAGGMDTYALQKRTLNQLESFHLANPTGAKTGESIPFFDILTEGHGLIGALGWAGKWEISFSRSKEESVSISAGMQNTHLMLHPGEEIRTPLVLLLPWSGDAIDAHNVLRRHVLKYHTPQYDGKPVVLPVSHGGWGGMKTSTSLKLLDQITKENIGYENFWMDAGWYGADREVEEFQVFGREDWFLHAGNWRINRIAHPDGLKPISDAVHAKGMKYLLWFEPERGVVGTPLTLEHPEWFIGEKSTNFEGNDARPFVKFRLFNFGKPDARKYMIDLISKIIADEGIDIYRQDCNFGLSDFWADADTPDRRGMAEINYVEGLLAFWDGLRQQHPGLILDIVQRGDLDTISRAVDLSRADYPVYPDADPIANQVSTEGLAYWRPHYGTILQIHPNDTYRFRSAIAPGLSFALFNAAGTKDQVGKFISPDFPFDWIRTMVQQLKAVRPIFYGDYYPMLPCSANADCNSKSSDEHSAAFEWAAWQFNRPEEGDGMIEAFRRDKNEDASKNLRLRGLDEKATYEVTNLDAKTHTKASGKELMQQGVRVAISEKPGAALILYKKVM